MTTATRTKTKQATTFKQFAEKVHKQFHEMSKGELYSLDVSKEDVWDLYLAAFPDGSNPIFRERTEHDCQCCRQFIVNLGCVVSLDDDGKMVSVWDVEGLDGPYAAVAGALSNYLKTKAITGVYRTKERSYGNETTWEHKETHATPNPSRILVQTKEEYDNLMIYLESIGHVWLGGQLPTEWSPVNNGWKKRGYDFIIKLNGMGRFIHQSTISFGGDEVPVSTQKFLEGVGWFPKKVVEDSQALEGQKEVEMVSGLQLERIEAGIARFGERLKVNDGAEMRDLMKFLHSQGYLWNSGASLTTPVIKHFPETINIDPQGRVTYRGMATRSAKSFLTEVGYYDSLLRSESKVSTGSKVSQVSKEKEMVTVSKGLVRRVANYAFVSPFKKSWNFAGKALPFAIFYGTIFGASYAGWSVYQNPAEIGKLIQEALPFEVKFKTENNSQE